MAKDKSPVKLRERPLKDGNKSLYLDIYLHGKRAFEFLHLYIIPEHTQMDKERNKTTRIQAEVIRAKRIIEIQEDETNIRVKREYKGTLCDYIREVAETKTERVCRNYKATAKRIEKCGGDRRLTAVTSDYLQKQCNELQKAKYTPHTIATHFAIVGHVLNTAVKARHINSNPQQDKPIKRPKIIHRSDNYLTLEEVQKVMQVKQNTPSQQRAQLAFLFACFTGLRISDLITLRWYNIKESEDGTKYVEKVQEKTQNKVIVPLSENALQFLPKTRIKPKRNEKVFVRLSKKTAETAVRHIREALQLDRRISFHTSRHTFATLLLTFGADIYSVSKLLGHTSISTTQIYAEVIQSKRAEVVAKIPTITK